MTLRETCDELEAALGWGPRDSSFRCYRLCLRALVALGDLQLEHGAGLGIDYAGQRDRFATLKARAEEVLGAV